MTKDDYGKLVLLIEEYIEVNGGPPFCVVVSEQDLDYIRSIEPARQPYVIVSGGIRVRAYYDNLHIENCAYLLNREQYHEYPESIQWTSKG